MPDRELDYRPALTQPDGSRWRPAPMRSWHWRLAIRIAPAERSQRATLAAWVSTDVPSPFRLRPPLVPHTELGVLRVKGRRKIVGCNP